MLELTYAAAACCVCLMVAATAWVWANAADLRR
jgi:hypothetical protein